MSWNLEKVEKRTKIFASASIPLLGLIITIVLHCDQKANRNQEAKIAEHSQRVQLFAEIMSKREQADSEIRAAMFKALLENYLKCDVKEKSPVSYTSKSDKSVATHQKADTLPGIREEILLLNLLIKNFEEYFNTRPLFEDLYRRIQDIEPPQRDELRNQLLAVAASIAQKQEILLARVGHTCDLSFEEGKSYCIPLYKTPNLYIEDGSGKLQQINPQDYISCKDRVRHVTAYYEGPKGFKEKFPQDLKGFINYDENNKKLIFKSKMTLKQKEDLLKVVENSKEYTDSIEKLYNDSQKLPDSEQQPTKQETVAKGVENEFYAIEVTAVEILDDSVMVKINVYKDYFKEKSDGETKNVYCNSLQINDKPIEFNVSYFDLPFMDNTRLFTGSRFAIVLRNIHKEGEDKAAELGFISFREDFMSVRDRPYFTQMLRELKMPK